MLRMTAVPVSPATIYTVGFTVIDQVVHCWSQATAYKRRSRQQQTQDGRYEAGAQPGHAVIYAARPDRVPRSDRPNATMNKAVWARTIEAPDGTSTTNDA